MSTFLSSECPPIISSSGRKLRITSLKPALYTPLWNDVTQPHHFTNRKLIRNKSLELAWSQNEHYKNVRLFAYFVKYFDQHRCFTIISDTLIIMNQSGSKIISHTEIKWYEPLFHKRKTTHSLPNFQSSLFLFISSQKYITFRIISIFFIKNTT